MRMLFAFAAFAGCLLGLVSTQTTCDTGLLLGCEANFTDTLQLSGANWHDPETFRQDVERLLQYPGVQGLARVCRAFTWFKQCLGDNYAPCLTVSTFVTSGFKPRQGYEFVKVFNQFHFTCGAGYNTFLNNDCMSATWQLQQQTLTNCRHQFDADADRDPTNVCVYARTAMNCYETQFLIGCTNSPDPGWWACEYERLGTAVMNPQCGLRCSLPSAGGTVGK
uniref:Secreted protein n=1 Tax=Plectus sambesii TaxID=2011161 RepID=A0A914X4M8_9BILA